MGIPEFWTCQLFQVKGSAVMRLHVFVVIVGVVFVFITCSYVVSYMQYYCKSYKKLCIKYRWFSLTRNEKINQKLFSQLSQENVML